MPPHARQAIDGAQPLRTLVSRLRQREHVVVERRERHLILRPERAEEFLHRVLQLRHRQRHALADVDRDDDLERRTFGREVPIVCGTPSSMSLNATCCEARHEAAVVGDDGGDLHDVDRHLLGLVEALGARAGDDASAADQVGDDAQDVRPDFGAGVPLAFRGDRIEDVADLLAIGEEQDLRDARREHLAVGSRPSACVRPLTYESASGSTTRIVNSAARLAVPAPMSAIESTRRDADVRINSTEV